MSSQFVFAPGTTATDRTKAADILRDTTDVQRSGYYPNNFGTVVDLEVVRLFSVLRKRGSEDAPPLTGSRGLMGDRWINQRRAPGGHSASG